MCYYADSLFILHNLFEFLDNQIGYGNYMRQCKVVHNLVNHMHSLWALKPEYPKENQFEIQLRHKLLLRETSRGYFH